jgi:hypothetical protein
MIIEDCYSAFADLTELNRLTYMIGHFPVQWFHEENQTLQCVYNCNYITGSSQEFSTAPIAFKLSVGEQIQIN